MEVLTDNTIIINISPCRKLADLYMNAHGSSREIDSLLITDAFEEVAEFTRDADFAPLVKVVYGAEVVRTQEDLEGRFFRDDLILIKA